MLLFLFCAQGKVYVMYIAMEQANHYDNWMKLATVSASIDQHFESAF